jgi:hypothetical protein
MIQMSVSELANLKTKKLTFQVFQGLWCSGFQYECLGNVFRVLLPSLKWGTLINDGLRPDGGAHPLIYRSNT